MSKHDKTVLFGHFRPRFFIIVISFIIAITVIIYAAYSYATPAYMLMGNLNLNNSFNSTINSTYTIIGNGAHNLTIEVTILNGLHEAMSGIAVSANANIGTITSCTTDNGTCFIHYAPPRTANSEKAILFINAGGLHKNINVNVTPDYPAQLLIYVNVTNQSTYTNSRVLYMIKAIDALGNPAPNGTIINVSYSGSGFLSATSCIITNGICNVTYTASSKPETDFFTFSSAGLSKQTYLNILPRIIRTKLFDFGTNYAGGDFYLIVNKPYFYESAYLNAGANVTWAINMPLSITTAFVLNNQSEFYKFTNWVLNATQEYTIDYNTCEYSTFPRNSTLCGTWHEYGYPSPCGTLYCVNSTTADFMSLPYAGIQSLISELSPVTVYYPQPNSYVGNLSFTAPVSGTYYFVLFASQLQPAAYDGAGQWSMYPLPPSYTTSYYYSDSYAYTTEIVTR